MTEIQFHIWLTVQVVTVVGAFFGGSIVLFKIARWVGAMTKEVKYLARDVDEAKQDAAQAHTRIDTLLHGG